MAHSPAAMPHDYDATRRSWNAATRNHNAHKGDQAAFLKGGGDTLFSEELELLGDLRGKDLVHLQCNSGQDSLCLSRLGARVTGVDFSDEAVAFARELSLAAQLPAEFVLSEVVGWLHHTHERFHVAFSSYGAVGWLPDLDRWAEGIARVLHPGGRFVLVEFHPLVWSITADGKLAGDDYFADTPFLEPVGDYVKTSGPGLLAKEDADTEENQLPAHSWQHTLGEVVSALACAGLVVEQLHEYAHANGCRVNDTLVLGEDRRWRWPPGKTRVPLMFGLSARVSDEG